MKRLPSVIPVGTIVTEADTAAATAVDADSEEDEMERRLQALRS